MAVIEHKTAEGVLDAFNSVDNTKFALWQGNTQVYVYEGDDKNEALDKLTDWLTLIENGGTRAIYTLKVYNDAHQDITSKTAYKMATRFQLSQNPNDAYQQTPEGKVMVIREGNRTVGNTAASYGNNAQLQAILDGQNRLIEMMAKQMEVREASKVDKLIGFLEESTKTKQPDIWDKITSLGEMVISKPDIIDRIGYIIRPSIYQRIEQPLEPINGTAAETAAPTTAPENINDMADKTADVNLSDSEVDALNDSLDTALDTIEDSMGLQAMVALFQKLATYSPEKLTKLTPEKLATAMGFL